jgi:hypothetical protein
MPFIRYFSFVGGALVLLLIGLSWCFPQPVSWQCCRWTNDQDSIGRTVT